MRFRSTFAFLAVLVTAASVPGQAQEAGGRFAGLWQGIDHIDGSLRSISIIGPAADGSFDVLGHDSYWTLCHGSRGLQQSRGVVGKDGILRTLGSLACQNGERVQVELTYRPQGPDRKQLHETTLGTPFENVLFRSNQPSPASRAR